MFSAVYMSETLQQGPQDLKSDCLENWCPLESRLPASAGLTYELCAGIVDKPELSLKEIARQEVLEECGYDVPLDSLKRITSYRKLKQLRTVQFKTKEPAYATRSGVGVTGSKQTLFYAEVTDEMKTGKGGGCPEEGELIEAVEIPLRDSMDFAFDETFPKTMGVIFCFMWFQSNIAPKLPAKVE
uniref:Uncharacterized protein n=1 Tax=Sphaerodactylus townsendi TaxID=933632 RepID=A0ACB8G6W2_9SAUR